MGGVLYSLLFPRPIGERVRVRGRGIHPRQSSRHDDRSFRGELVRISSGGTMKTFEQWVRQWSHAWIYCRYTRPIIMDTPRKVAQIPCGCPRDHHNDAWHRRGKHIVVACPDGTVTHQTCGQIIGIFPTREEIK